MATHDYNIANQIGSEFRADLNNALLAIVSNNSNATSPSTTYAYQLWVDTANNVLKLRNSANSDWITTGISITASNSFTGDITGNSATATALATARTINGVSFDGTANISFNTDSVSEGSSNLYFTNERVDDQVNSLLTAGSGISLTYDDAAGTLTIANTNSADITSVVAGDGLTGGGTSGDVTLAVSVDDSSIEINSDALRVKASGVTNAMLAGSIANDKLAGSIANSKLANSSVTINSQAISLGGSHTFNSDDIGEGSSNLYFTNARARGSLSIGSEGSASGNGAIAYNSSTGVFTYTPPVISGLSGDTDDLSEGSSNLYYTDARSNAAIDARVTNTFINNLSGVVADTATALATARSIALSGDVTASGVNFDGTGDITLSTTIAANSVALGTDTTGNYVAGISGTTNEIDVSGSGSETASVTIGLPDNVTIAGNLTVNGTTTTVNTETLEVEDPLIKLAKANSGADSVDIGFYGLYDTSGSQDLYAGLFRDASDSGKFKLFKDLQAEPTTTVNTSGTGYAVGTLVSNLEGDVTGNVTGNVTGSSGSTTGNAATATALETARTIGGVSFDGTGNIDLAGVNTTGNQDTTGNAATATTAGTVTTAAQPNITSLGTLSTLAVNGDITLTENDKIKTAESSGGSHLLLRSDNLGVTGNSLSLISLNDILIGAKSNQSGTGNIYFGYNAENKASGSGWVDTLTITESGNFEFNDGNFTEVGTINSGAITTSGETLSISHTGNTSTLSFTQKAGTQNSVATISANREDTSSSASRLIFSTNDGTSTLQRIRIGNGGDISFYEDTGTTAALFWDASTERLGLGTTSPSEILTVAGNIANVSGDMTLDVAGDIILDADGSQVFFKDGGTTRYTFNLDATPDLVMAGGNASITTSTSNADFTIIGNDGGSDINALTFDMSDAGAATFNSSITVANTISISSSNTSAFLQASDNVFQFGTSSDDPVIFFENNAEKMRLTSGNLGLGTSSPEEALHVSGNMVLDRAAPRLFFQTGSTHYNWKVSTQDSVNKGFEISSGEVDADANSDTYTARLVIEGDTGHVGLGTSNPAQALEINGNVLLGNNQEIRFKDSSGTQRTAIELDGSNNLNIGTSANGNLVFINGSSYTERVRIDSNGVLQLTESSASGFVNANGTALELDVNRNPETGAFGDANKSHARILISGLDGGSHIQFNTADANNTVSSERARFHKDGHFLIGTTSNQGVGGLSFEKNALGFTTHNNNNGASGGYEFYVFRRSSSQIGSIAQSSTNAVTYNTSSDARLKDVTGSSRGLDVINSLNPVAYNWKSDNHADEGLIAQEVEELVPNAVNQNEDGYYQMDYSKLVTHLVKGMQEQQEQIESLKSEIANLKGE